MSLMPQKPQVRSLSCPRRPASGFALLELVLAMSVLTIGMVALSSTVWRVHALIDSNQSRRHVQNYLRAVNEEMLAMSQGALDEPGLWATALNAAFAPAGAPGNRFVVPGVDPIPGEPTVGMITIVTDETVTDAALGVRLGMPRDLDGDGLATSTDVSGSAQLLPVVLTAQWASEKGNRRSTHGFFLLGM